ncbi:MAG: hypothetical protein WAZ77_03040 [Candidatus Nitrosopolaris sp.]
MKIGVVFTLSTLKTPPTSQVGLPILSFCIPNREPFIAFFGTTAASAVNETMFK